MISNERCADKTCEDALAELEAYLDGELAPERLAGIREHLVACYPCTGRVTFEEQLRAIVRRECVEGAPESLVERIRQVLASDGGAEAGSDAHV